MSYEVDVGVELPQRPANIKNLDFVYPFESMGIGDSFFISLTESEFKKRVGKTTSMAEIVKDRVRRKARLYRKHVDPDFFLTPRDRNNRKDYEQGVRFWRIDKHSNTRVTAI